MNNIRCYIFTLDALCLIILCTVIYASSLHGEFVYDDLETIVKNPYVKDLKYVPGYFDPRKKEMWSFHYGQQQFYRPILLTSFALNYYISHLDPFSYHLINLILHIFNTLLVYKVIQNIARMLGPLENSKPPGARGIALMSALLFACHPMQTEAVSYIVSRSSLLSTFFILCSFHFFLRAIEEKKKYLNKIISLLCFILGLLTKEIAITVPLLALAFSVLYLTSHQSKRGWERALRISLPYFIVLIIYLLPRVFLFGKATLLSIKEMFVCYFVTALKGVFVYLKLLIFPVGQSVDHLFPIAKSPWEPTALLAFAGLLTFIWLLVVIVLPYSKILFFYAAWFAIAIIPNLAVPTLEPISEHTVYFPSLGFFAATSFVILTLWNRYVQILKKPIKMICIGLFSILILQLGFLTLNRNLVWQNNLLLWKDAVRKAPQKSRPHLNLGNAYHEAGRADLAMREYQTAISLDPENAEAFNNIGLIWLRIGDYGKAEEALKNSIRIKPFNPDALNNLGAVCVAQGRFEAAIPLLEDALRMRPNDAVAYANLGWVYSKTNNNDKVCDCLEMSIKLDPNYEKGVMLYGQFCAKKGHNSRDSD